MSLLRGIARPLLAAPLALDAIDALIHPDRHVAKLDALRPFFRASKSEATLRILILISPAARESAPALLSSQREPSRWGKRLVPVLRS